jgi:hypothetical protein
MEMTSRKAPDTGMFNKTAATLNEFGCWDKESVPSRYFCERVAL